MHPNKVIIRFLVWLVPTGK